MSKKKKTEKLPENQETSLLSKNVIDSSACTQTDTKEVSLLEQDDRVAANLIEDTAVAAVDSEEALAEKKRIIDEHNKRVMQSPEFKAQVIYDNYIKSYNLILDGVAKRRLRKKFLRESKKGKYDYLFDPEKIAKRQAREQLKFDKLNAPIVHSVEELDEETQSTLKEMASMEIIKKD